MKQWIARHDTSVFLILTFGISWPLWLLSGALQRTPIRAPDLSWLAAQIGVFAPAFAGMMIGSCVEPGKALRARRLLAFVYAPAVGLGLYIATRGFSSFFAVDAISTWGMIALAVWVLVCFSAQGNRPVSWFHAPAGGMTVFLWSAGCLLAPRRRLICALAWFSAAPAGALCVLIPYRGRRASRLPPATICLPLRGRYLLPARAARVDGQHAAAHHNFWDCRVVAAILNTIGLGPILSAPILTRAGAAESE